MAISAREGRFFGMPFEQFWAQSQEVKEYSVNIEEIRKLFPEAASMRRIGIDEIIVKNVNDEQIGCVLHTMPSCSDISGYAANVPVLIGLSNERKIVGLELQENKETKWFVERVLKRGLLNSWTGTVASEAVVLKVDAVSGATMTSNAIIKSVNRRLAAFEKVIESRQGMSFVQILHEFFAWGFLAVAVFAFFPKSPLAKYRKYVLLASLLIPGLWLSRFVSLALVGGWASAGVPIETQLYMVVLVVLALFIPLFTGKSFYCTWYCPFGAAQELVGSLCPKKFTPSGEFREFLVRLRPSILMIISFLLIAGVKIDLNSVEPFSAFVVKSSSFAILVFASIFLVLSFVLRRPWCNYFCPTGQILECVRTGMVSCDTAIDPCSSNQCNSSSGDSNITRGTQKVKISEVINLLLAIAIIVILLGPSAPSFTKMKGGEVAVSGAKAPASASAVVAPNGDAKTSEAKGVEKLSENQTLKIIHQRKSVRNFEDKPVTKEQFETLVRAAMAAPTAKNAQPWQFIVVDEREKLNKMAEGLPYAKMLEKAAGAVVVCGDMTIATDMGTEKLWEHDCSAATENLLLAAESMGLGAVWTAAHPYEDRVNAVKQVLSLPDNVIPLCVVPVGYPTGVDKPKDKWKPERLHWNEYLAK
ncbi:MAG: nitroreductase family protein [Candidatus Riflebacteria bacterium]|nr:nitroreductase family protein [Candidatus Riflebacteria bacterium]